jgi:raffinose/stachyose/melibiose transport system permease protein
VLYAALVLAPLGHNGWLSLFKWNGVTQGRFVGVDNYVEIVTSEQLRTALVHIGQLLLFFSVLPTAVGLVLAALIARVAHRAATVYRVILFAPQVIATVAIAVGWQWILAPNGPLNGLLSLVGLGDFRQPWLGSFEFALPAVGLIGAWITTGLCVVLFLAGIQRIPDALYDAVKVDGGGPIREFFTVTIPGLRQEISVVVVITIILGLRAFDVVYVTTAGGPGTATIVPSLIIFREAFRLNQVGLACATAVVFLVIILLVTVGVRRLLDERDR